MLTRRLLALVLLAVGVVLPASATVAPAYAACPPDRGTLADHVQAADAVFSGTVTARRSEGDRRVYTVAVDQVFKGTVDAEATVSTPPPRSGCEVLLDRDAYVFLASEEGSGLSTDSRSGTMRAAGDGVARVERLLGAGSSPTPPEPVEATFTQVAGEPEHVTRLAAPGLALVIVGALGLVLVAALSRRRG